MKTNKKRLLSILLSLALVLGLLPGTSLTAWAEEKSVTFTNAGTQDGITVVADAYVGNQFFINSSSSVTISSSNYDIIKLEVTDGGRYSGRFNDSHIGVSTGTQSIQGSILTVTDINAKSVKLLGINGNNYWTASKIVVYYDEAPAVVNVTGVNLNKTSTELTVGGNETLTATVLPDNATDKTVTWSSSDESVATVDNNGTVAAVGVGTATITVTATNGTDSAEDDKTATCKVTVEKGNSSVVTAPIANTLTYNGKPQELVTAGKAEGGEMQYTLGKDATTAPSDGWSASIPTATDAGTYYVWYKVVGDENHSDTEPDCIKVTIAEAKREESDTSIETEVNVSEDAPVVKVDNLDEELAVELLTDEEKEAYNQSTPVLVYLDVKTLAKADVPAVDLEAVEKVTKKDDYTYGECLDFSLWKKLGDAEPTQIHDTNGKPIKLTVTIPDSMKSAPTGYTRIFRIIRVHDGVAEVLAEGTGATLEVSSDRFSSYFLVYKDSKEAAATEATTAASTSDATTAASTTEAAKTSPKTGDSMPIAVLIVLMLSAAGVLVFMDQKKKRN